MPTIPVLITVQCTSGGQAIHSRITASYVLNDKTSLEHFETGKDGMAMIRIPEGSVIDTILAQPLEFGGLWRTVGEAVDDHCHIEYPSNDNQQQQNWWHEIHGVNVLPATRGKGLRVGIIDESIPMEETLPHVKVLGRMDDEQLVPLIECHTDHGLQVTTILASRAEASQHLALEGMAPGIEGFFLSARSTKDPKKLNPVAVAAAIQHLAQVEHCDLIVVSAGESPTPISNIEFALEDAAEVGCLCIFAAGNRPGDVLYPACYDKAIAVAAIGKAGFAPQKTLPAFFEQESMKVEDIFFWNNSPTGEQLNCIAAGIGIFTNHSGEIYTDAIGSSYAAPMAAGVLACQLSLDDTYRNLPREKVRFEHARDTLAEICYKYPSKGEIQGYGLPKIDFDRLKH